MYEPDYETLRDETPFSWFVASGCNGLLEATGISQKEMFLNPLAGIELYKKGRPILLNMFGPNVRMPAPSTPPISYGHINALGAELFFPDDGEVNHGTLCETLEQGVEILKKTVDFSQAGMAPFYLEYRRKMQDAFPSEKVGYHYVSQGPITTAYTLRRDDFFYDPYDNPELTKEFLRLITDSIIQFNYFRNKVLEMPRISPKGGNLCDDCSAMLGPDLWPEFVIPYIEQYYRGLTTGKRFAHIEDLRPEQLQFLEKLQLASYDPSVSAKINPRIIKEHTRVPFSWRLIEFCYPNLSPANVSDFVYQAIADGASGVFTYITHGMCNNESVKKIHSFISACKEAEQILKKGGSIQEIGKMASSEAKKRFWDNWP
jgi:hypothetical protein